MSVINLTDSEKDALKAIDERELDRLIDQAVEDENARNLDRLPLWSCGPYVVNELRSFGRSLIECRESKSAKKRSETLSCARRAGYSLSAAVVSMKHRMETEEREGQLFYVEDQIFCPHHFSKNLEVRISYRWRRTIEDKWTFGSITFHHEYVSRSDYLQPRPKRKPSPAKQARELQDELSRTWEHLKSIALYTLRDYFKEGGDGSKIPETFRARPDPYTGHLNNFSAKFWHEKAQART